MKDKPIFLRSCFLILILASSNAQAQFPIHFGAAWNALWNGKPKAQPAPQVNVSVTQDNGMAEYTNYLREINEQKRAEIQKAVQRRLRAIAARNQEISQEQSYAESHQSRAVDGIDFEFDTHQTKNMSHKTELQGNKDSAIASCQRQNSNEFVDLMQVAAYRKVVDTLKINRVSFGLIDNRNGSRGDKMYSDMRGSYVPQYSTSPSVTSYFGSGNWLECIRSASTQAQAKSCCAASSKTLAKDSFDNSLYSCQGYWNQHGYGAWCNSCFGSSTKAGKKSLASTHLEVTGLILADPTDTSHACVSVTEELVAEFEILAKKYNIDTSADVAGQE